MKAKKKTNEIRNVLRPKSRAEGRSDMLLLSSFLALPLSFSLPFASFGAMSRTGVFAVSGSGSGIGLAIAEKIMDSGSRVFGLGRDEAKLRKIKQARGEAFEFLSADLSNKEGADRATRAIEAYLQQSGLPLLGLVNNAGIFERVDFDAASDEVWERNFTHNLMSAVRLSRGLKKRLEASAPASVLNISSTLGVRPVASTSPYSAMKAAMVNLTHSLALEWAKAGIRVNCICPGLVDTPIHAFHGLKDDDPNRAFVHGLQPLARVGQTTDIASAAMFLLGSESSWTTGAVLTVDGGISL